jgi:UDP-N-acetylglucosamine 2-epimerase
MIYPIIDSIGAEKCLLIKNGPSTGKIFEDIYEIDYEDALKTPSIIWIKEYLLNFLRWNNHIKNVCKELGLPNDVFINITTRLTVSTQYISGWIYLLLKNKPSIVITESDRNSKWSTVILAAKCLGIPTVTLVHGVINENALGYSPVVADDVLCWGNLQRDKLIEEGVNKNNIRVVGCPRLKNKSCLTSDEAKSKIGVPVELNAIMLATSPVSDEESDKIVTTFCEAVEMEKNWFCFVKLHPSEHRARYKHLIDKYQNVHFFEDGEVPIDYAIAASDVVVVKDSGVGGDAIISRKPVIVLSPNGKPAGYGMELVEKAGCPLAKNERELKYEITRCLANKDKPNFITQKYVEDFCIAFGEDSAKRISQYILEKM